MTSSGARTRVLRRLRFGRAFFVPLLCCAFSDQVKPQSASVTQPPKVAAAPAGLDTSAFAGMSDRDLRIAVLTKLMTLEARLEQKSKLAQARLGEILRGSGVASPAALTRGAGMTPAAAQGSNEASLTFAAQGSVCVQGEFGGAGTIEFGTDITAHADGHPGLDVYGNGGKGLVRGAYKNTQELIQTGGLKVSLQLCGQATPAFKLARLASGNAGAAAVAPPGPAETILRNVLQAVSVDQIATLASRLGMDGSRMGPAVDAFSTFTLADLPFGRGGASALLNGLPLPPTAANLLRNPEDIFLKAAEAGQLAISRLCDPNLFAGEIGQKAQLACNLRNQLPSAQALTALLHGLTGLP